MIHNREENSGAPLLPQSGLLFFVGAFGSGKSELAVNWALDTVASTGGPVRLVDLDIANPYFRSREVRDVLEASAVEVVLPHSEEQFSDLPVLSPRLRGVLADAELPGLTIVDVGGDAPGAKVLGSLRDAVGQRPYAMIGVVNACRPFTDDPQSCATMLRGIESVTGLAMSGIVSNAHLLEDTTVDIVARGAAVAAETARNMGVAVAAVCAMEPLDADAAVANLGYPILSLRRRLMPPWKKRRGDSVWPRLAQAPGRKA